MAFSGTQQKCKACDKTVHFVESLSADGAVYHKNCFRCSHCNGLLVISNYSSMEGVLYCKVHFEQLFKETGTYTKKFQSAGKPPNELSRAPSKLSAFFSGTQDKCSKCKKTVYPLEKLTVEGEFYHKSCFRCAHGGCFLTPSSYAALDGFLYCKPHFSQLFKEKGSYSYLSKTASMKKNEEQMAAEKTEDKTESETEKETEKTETEAEAETAKEAEQGDDDAVPAQE
ncbi:LIM domain-containing protein WLIM2b-like [Abrus precatorius]|uniref:LIM domain-containing protein WLIM2b-like n=1 Tax=Abrus precatorius TaxID=3816 RepID=A0A8B8KH79_ABRPR|nr:LIM domain-containing protein WLIM2b-like [Abrus precatorius]